MGTNLLKKWQKNVTKWEKNDFCKEFVLAKGHSEQDITEKRNFFKITKNFVKLAWNKKPIVSNKIVKPCAKNGPMWIKFGAPKGAQKAP